MFRHLRLLGSFARFSLLNEMAFRANYLIKVFVELLWLVLMIIFYNTLFEKTGEIAGWNRFQYFFFLGCFYVLEGVMETFFLSNFGEFAEMVRTGNLDLILVQPVDEQFMISFKSIEWSTVPNVIMGLSMMGYSAWNLQLGFDAGRIATFVIGMGCGVVIAYSFILMLASTSVWLVRNQSLYEMWWLFTSLMRYPREIYETSWAWVIGRFFTFAVPALLAINVPAAAMVKGLEPFQIEVAGLPLRINLVLYAVISSIVLYCLSRRVFRRALQSYRSASS